MAAICSGFESATTMTQTMPSAAAVPRGEGFTPLKLRCHARPTHKGRVLMIIFAVVNPTCFAAGSMEMAVSDTKIMYPTEMPKHVMTLSTLHSVSPAGPSAAPVRPAYVCTSAWPDTTLPSTSVSCALTSMRSDSRPNTREHARHAVTSTVPPCAYAQGREKPPAPRWPGGTGGGGERRQQGSDDEREGWGVPSGTSLARVIASCRRVASRLPVRARLDAWNRLDRFVSLIPATESARARVP